MQPYDILLTTAMELGAEVERVISNYKKDSKQRKSNKPYYEERIRRLKQLWLEFEDTDKELKSSADVDWAGDYFKSNYYGAIKGLVDQYLQVFMDEMAALDQEAIPNQTATLQRNLNAPGKTLVQGAIPKQNTHGQGLPATPAQEQAGGGPEASTCYDEAAQLQTNSAMCNYKFNIIYRRQRAMIASIQRLLEGRTMEDAPVQYLNAMEKLWNQIEEAHYSIWELCEHPEDNGYDMNKYAELEDKVRHQRCAIEKRISRTQTVTSTPSHPSVTVTSTPSHPSVKLPKITIPRFDGDYAKWKQFHDMFTQVVHNQDISAIQKMWYLKGNLSGEAERLIRHLALTEENYKTAWDLLQSRYNNVRVLSSTLIQRLLSQPSCSGTSTSIKNLHDSIQDCLLSLNNLGIKTDTWDPILLQILTKKLDKHTHTLYEQSLKAPKELQSMKEFSCFLENQFQSLEAVGGKDKPVNCHSTTIKEINKPLCKYCSTGNHPLFSCKRFLEADITARRHFVQKNGFCHNCLRLGHFSSSCQSQCCLKCDRKHNSLLHVDKSSTPDSASKHTPKTQKTDNQASSSGKNQQSSTNQAAPSTTLMASSKPSTRAYILLNTAVVKVLTSGGKFVKGRAILDSGSQINVITDNFAKLLGHQYISSQVCIEGIGKGQKRSHHRTVFEIQSRINNFTTPVEAFVLPQIMSHHPTQDIEIEDWPIPQNIHLADPEFNHPAQIDLLLGAEFYHQIMAIGQIKLGEDRPILQNTVFGWTLSGKVRTENLGYATCGVCTEEDVQLNSQLERFWELDTIIPVTRPLSATERLCEVHFAVNTTRNKEGRYVVRIPFAEDPSMLGESKQMAVNRFHALERRLANNHELKTQYIEFMQDYENLGHMTKINIQELQTPSYVIPHHCITRPDSSSTKLRVVFDASAKSSSGLSLNDLMYTGPTVQDELLSILLRFRTPRFVFTSDIQKMYRQILVHPDDQRFQVITWRSNPERPLNYYKLNTVTYGTRSAPYLATKCLTELAKEAEKQYPLAARVLKRDFYVDDCLSGFDNLRDAIEAQQQLTTVLQSAGFKLRKWSANHAQLLQSIPKEDQEVNLDFGEDSYQSVKTLGLTWLPKTDQFCVKATPMACRRVTKRSVASGVAKIYDPLGILAPVVIVAKMLLQEIWQLKISWDEALTEEMHSRWTTFQSKLQLLNNMTFSRYTFGRGRIKEIQIHAFSDASEKAYGAAVYLRSINEEGTIKVMLLCARSRVAPLKRLTLPRLELCAAVLSAELVKRVKHDLSLEETSTYFWTDSQIVLAWINSSSSSYQTFVANRIAAIQEVSIAQQWRHVSSKENTADFISRGLAPEKFKDCSVWFYGPIFLHGRSSCWPQPFKSELMIETDLEKKKSALTSAVSTAYENGDVIYHINHNNSFKRLQRVVAYIIRFKTAAKNRKVKKLQLTSEECDAALFTIVRAIQRLSFHEEIKLLKKGRSVNKSSTLSCLMPFLDLDGILRVGGRLESSELSYDAKHQMILPYNDPIVKLLVEKLHIENMHCGPQTLLAITRQRFWPLKGKTMARSACQHCVRCTRARPQMYSQVMGNLPAHRITPSRPFVTTGVDYFGPMWIHYKIRGKRPQKAYASIFCCFVTKAVHIELVTDLTTDAFVAALKRFIGRCGYCQTIFCDNATNFTGAKNQLQELASCIHSADAQDHIIKECSNRGIEFKFIPPRSPHFGGLWEAAVKSAKGLLVKTVQSGSLTYEQLETVLIEAEAILNSRPLTPMSEDPRDFSALTPGHFLIGAPMNAMVDPRADAPRRSLTTMWKSVVTMKQEFWRRWSNEYLNQLQYRYKWKEPKKNIEPGQMVIMKDDNAPPLKWPLGRIEKVYQGNDGVVRVVDVRTASGILKRSIQMLAPLFKDEDPSPTEESSKEVITKSTKRQKESGELSPKRKRGTSNQVVLAVVLSILLLPLALGKSIKITPLSSKPGIYFEGIGTAKFVTADWKLVLYYQLEPVRSEINAFYKGIETLQQLCARLQHGAACNATVINFEHIKDDILSDSSILLRTRQKRGAVNAIGNLANALFGVLDSEYAKEMSHTINQVQTNENYLQNLLRNQTSIIDSTINIIKQTNNRTLSKIVQLQEQINSSLNSLSKENDEIRALELFSALSTQLTTMSSHLQRVKAITIDVLTSTHQGQVNPLLLTPSQLNMEIQNIKGHLPPSRRLPVEQEDFVQLYKTMRIKAALSGDQVIFVVTIPLVDEQHYDLFKVIAIPAIVNKTMTIITHSTEVLAVNAHQDEYIPLSATELGLCTRVKQDIYICSNKQMKYGRNSASYACEIQLFNSKQSPACALTHLTDECVWTPMTNPNRWIYSMLREREMTAVCASEIIQVTLLGSGVLELQPNCVIRDNMITILGHHESSTILHNSYVRFKNISSNDTITTTINQPSGKFSLDLEKLTALQEQLRKNDVQGLPEKLGSSNLHQYTVSYTALVSSVVLLVIFIWRFNRQKFCNKVSVPRNEDHYAEVNPNPAPRPASPRFSVNVV